MGTKMTLHFVADKNCPSLLVGALFSSMASVGTWHWQNGLFAQSRSWEKKLPVCGFAWVVYCVGERSYRLQCCGGGWVSECHLCRIQPAGQSTSEPLLGPLLIRSAAPFWVFKSRSRATSDVRIRNYRAEIAPLEARISGRSEGA